MTNQQFLTKHGIKKIITYEEVRGASGKYVVDIMFENGHAYTSYPPESDYGQEINSLRDIEAFVTWCVDKDRTFKS